MVQQEATAVHSANVQEAMARLKRFIHEFENEIDECRERHERPDLWDHVSEVAIPDAKIVLAALASHAEAR